MMPIYRYLIRPLCFRMQPETAHHLAVFCLKLLGRLPVLSRWIDARCRVRDSALEQRLFGLSFDNPVGFAAGFDKNGEIAAPLAAFGFSHIEVGTVTRLPQPGNPRPRCFRLVPDRSIVNRMGINNDGAERIGVRLRARFGLARERRQRPFVLGINIGKSTAVDSDKALADQLACLEPLAPLADYLVVNVSCPNVKGVTSFQAADQLRPLLTGLRACLRELAPTCPLLVKVSPDLDDDGLDAVADVALDCGCDGFVATNTTTARTDLTAPATRVEAIGEGGLSGAALRARSTERLARLARRVAGRVPIIGVGGIEDVDSAWDKIVHGASLLQVYTGFIYQGPGLVRTINRGLLDKLREHGFRHIGEAVGSQLFRE